MNVVDIVILCIIVLAAVGGAVKGLVHQVGTLAAVLCAVLVCRFFGTQACAAVVDESAKYVSVYRVLVYLLLFVGVFFVVRLIAGLFGTALGKMHVRALDRIAGAVFGASLAVLVMSVMLNVYLTMAPADRPAFENSRKPWRTAVLHFAPAVMGYVKTAS